MQGSARLILIGVFATIGIALAIGLATSPQSGALRNNEGSADLAPTDSGAVDIFEPSLIAPSLDHPPLELPQHLPGSLENIAFEDSEGIEEERNGIGPRGLFEEIDHNHARQEAEHPFPPEDAVPPPLEIMPHDHIVERISPPPAEVETPLAEVRPSDQSSGLVINIQKTEIREVLDLLSQHGGLNIISTPSVQGDITASFQDVDVMTALDAILRSTGFIARHDGPFIYVGTREDFLSMDHSLDEIGTRIYRPNYATSSEIEQLIVSMLTPDVGSISISSPSQVGIAANGDEAGGDDFSGNEVLIVRDYEGVLYEIDQIVTEIDQPPLQVSIEAMILSVRLDDSNEFGVNFETLLSDSNSRLVSGSPASTLADIELKSGGLKFGFLDGNLGLFVNALESIGDTNVVASPRIMCMNKQPANILIGSQLGYISTTVTENAATQSVEFLEVGTQLRLRPFISADGMIRMEIHPELSTGTVRIEEGFTLPDKEVTQVTTNIMCRDGATLLIGGLIREDLSTTSQQIPFLGSMPFVGPIFRQKKESIDRREVIVLITSRIVCLPLAESESAQSAFEFQRRQGLYSENMSPLGTRNTGLRYFRLAQAAWYAGDVPRANRYVNLAIHFNPLHRESINLHAEIMAHSNFGNAIIPASSQESPWPPQDESQEYFPGVTEYLNDGESPTPASQDSSGSGALAPIHRLDRMEGS